MSLVLAELKRIISRVLYPTGIILVTTADREELKQNLHPYFRRVIEKDALNYVDLWKAMILSTLIITKKKRRLFKLFSKRCVVTNDQSHDSVVNEVLKTLKELYKK